MLSFLITEKHGNVVFSTFLKFLSLSASSQKTKPNRQTRESLWKNKCEIKRMTAPKKK